ncbi:hypothetical protein KIN20_007838 [Parelaphostrongylus tenuis]|uniref:Uncharacterized protein n=1 Tax=Parelaphostrongylus tenuis TaxID=148309 RepID=A0AAD5QH34_PARTN|nr:hypothetical protein KIN20_007838 [Parelaphostrongylus tenuis]
MEVEKLNRHLSHYLRTHLVRLRSPRPRRNAIPFSSVGSVRRAKRRKESKSDPSDPDRVSPITLSWKDKYGKPFKFSDSE